MSEETDRGADRHQPASSGRVSFSVDTLRTEIRIAVAELELRLVEKLASKDTVDRLSSEVAGQGTRLAALEKSSAQREPLAVKFEQEWDAVKKDVEHLKTNKAEDDAVQSYKRYFIGGGVLAAFFMAAQLMLAIYVQTQGG